MSQSADLSKVTPNEKCYNIGFISLVKGSHLYHEQSLATKALVFLALAKEAPKTSARM